MIKYYSLCLNELLRASSAIAPIRRTAALLYHLHPCRRALIHMDVMYARNARSIYLSALRAGRAVQIRSRRISQEKSGCQS